MKTAVEFWKTIEVYNVETFYFQSILSFILIGMLIFSFINQRQLTGIILKSLFSLAFFFVGIYFFLLTDNSFTAKIFGPYFIVIGFLFLFDLFKIRTQFQPPSLIQFLLYGLTLLYPLISYLLNHRYPQQVLYILPCPIVSLALITYSRFEKRNNALYILLVLWGLTGVKAFIFDVKEDLILLMVGVYGLINFITFKRKT